MKLESGKETDLSMSGTIGSSSSVLPCTHQKLQVSYIEIYFGSF